MKALLITITMLMSLQLFAAEGWMTNFEEAKAKAAKEGKSLLVDFTGSDWCGYCIKLHNNVFSKSEFTDYAKDKFILVELDFPKRKEIAADLKAQNQMLAQKYQVQGYPTVLLMDSSGRPFAKTGFRPGGPDVYNKHLDDFLVTKAKFDTAYKAAESAKGVDRAKLLVEAISNVDPKLAKYYSEMNAEIKKLDPKDTTGYVKKQETAQGLQELQGKIQGLARAKKKDEAFKEIDMFITKYSVEGTQKQLAMFNKVYFLAYPPKTVEDLNAADGLMNDIIAVKADSPIAKQCESIKVKINSFREKIEKK